MPMTIAHATTDSLPRVVVVTAGTSTLDVLLPFRVDLDDPAWTVTGWELDVEVDGRSWGSRVRTRRLRDGLARSMWDRMTRSGVYTFDHLPYYVNLRDDDIRANRSVYLECLLPAVPRRIRDLRADHHHPPAWRAGGDGDVADLDHSRPRHALHPRRHPPDLTQMSS